MFVEDCQQVVGILVVCVERFRLTTELLALDTVFLESLLLFGDSSLEFFDFRVHVCLFLRIGDLGHERLDNLGQGVEPLDLHVVMRHQGHGSEVLDLSLLEIGGGFRGVEHTVHDSPHRVVHHDKCFIRYILNRCVLIDADSSADLFRVLTTQVHSSGQRPHAVGIRGLERCDEILLG